ncbi:MAG: hypothetical protein P1V19_13530 [Gimesia sp.]|nr:hypothetical protein [Gimesia sp.]
MMKFKIRKLRSIKKLQNSRTKRGGSVVLIPMICLILALAIIGELLQQTSIELKQLKKGQHHLQANWLADAAAQRAVEKLSQQQKYAGETWKIQPAEIGGTFPGEVIIEIVRTNPNSKSLTIRTLASYPANAIERVRIIREWPFELQDRSSNN